ncbi:MAG: GntR family transcriptional regulator [Pseudomonadales bacterium]|nr:GntR family transcriptional regulator [Pseudomonadales bacterium]
MATANSISCEIATSLRTDILRQRYLSGDRLPSERELAVRFDASRGAVREALSQLEQSGLIDIQRGGARVKPIEEASISVLGPLMTLDEIPNPALVDKFLQTFGALSALTAREAINHANQEDMNRLRKMVVSLNKQAKDFETMQPPWREFLESLAEIADNLVVHLISNDLQAQFVEQMTRLGFNPELRKKVVNEVLSSLKQAVANRDGDLAQSAVQQYFDEVRGAVIKLVDSRLGAYRKQAV